LVCTCRFHRIDPTARIKVLAIFFCACQTSFDWWIPYILFPDYSPNVFFFPKHFPREKVNCFSVFPFCKCNVYTHDVSFYCKHCNCLFFSLSLLIKLGCHIQFIIAFSELQCVFKRLVCLQSHSNNELIFIT